jgi:glycosyltransferase involved in cell wall biosynthesis
MPSPPSESSNSSQRSSRRHIVFLQYGDYRAAVKNFEAGGHEAYAAQRYSVAYVAGLTSHGKVTVICIAAEPHDEVLTNGVRAIGLGWSRRADYVNFAKTLARLKPTDLIVTTPMLPALVLGLLPGVRVLPLFADSFGGTGLRASVMQKALAALLSNRSFPIVANHNVPASLDLARIGVPGDKIVPWDWPSQHTPNEFAVRTHPGAGKPFSVFFAGSICEAKGVGDIIRAVNELKRGGFDARADIAGSGDVEVMKALASELGVSERVNFLGKIPNREVVHQMHMHDAVAVPSRLESAEGLAMTIYEALCSRSPLLLSDHPMFLRALGGHAGVLMFRAGRASSLAQAIRNLAEDPSLYESVSRASLEAWNQIQVPLKIGEVMDSWLRGAPEDLSFLRRHSVTAQGYDRTSR